MIELFMNNAPTVFGIFWMAWWARRRIEQCEARCARELERIIAMLPPSEQPGVTYEAPPVLVLEETPAPLPVARALKA